MEFNIDEQRSFWNKRFQNEGNVWGDNPSATAALALEIFRRHMVKNILVPGSGYGRNTKLLSMNGFQVSGIDISAVVCELARKFDPLTEFHNGSVLDMSFLTDTYDAIYCFNTLHLFYENERAIFIDENFRRLKEGGLAFFTVFSENEPSFGKNRSIEKNTYESRPGRPTHYFSDDDLRWHFRDFIILLTGVFDEWEDHSQGAHVHRLRYVFVKKLS